jgi:hypothetical protein
MITASELDRLLLSFCGTELRKVARIVGNTFTALEEQGVQIDGTIADQIDARLAVLVGSGQLEAAGKIKKWRYSEARLPARRRSRRRERSPV